MHLIDAWMRLAPLDLARLLALPLALLLAALLPGRRAARTVALLGAAASALLFELAVPWPVRAGWVALWLLIAWQVGRPDAAERRAPRPARRAALESGAIAVALGLALAGLLLAAVARQNPAEADARRASLGALLIAAGALHLMMRRHIRRAALARAAFGVGLELLASSA